MIEEQSKFGLLSLVKDKLVSRFTAGEGIGWEAARVLGSTVDGAIGTGQLEGHTLEASIGIGLPDGKVSNVNLLPGQLGEGSSAEDGDGGGESETHLEFWSEVDRADRLTELCGRIRTVC